MSLQVRFFALPVTFAFVLTAIGLAAPAQAKVEGSEAWSTDSTTQPATGAMDDPEVDNRVDPKVEASDGTPVPLRDDDVAPAVEEEATPDEEVDVPQVDIDASADDDSDVEADDDVVAQLVVPAEPIISGCNVTIPESDGVTYSAVLHFEDFVEVGLEPGTYPVAPLASAYDLYINASPADGFTFAAEGEEFFDLTEFDLPFSEDCLNIQPAELVDANASCEAITFTNVFTDSIDVVYGSESDEEPAGEISLTPGQKKTVQSLDAQTFYAAFVENFTNFFLGEDGGPEEEIDSNDLFVNLLSSFEVGDIAVQQGCEVISPKAVVPAHPTVAPAAGV